MACMWLSADRQPSIRRMLVTADAVPRWLWF